MKTDWKEIMMILGASAGGILSVLLYIITKNNLSLMLFVLGLSGGWILGFIIKMKGYIR